MARGVAATSHDRDETAARHLVATPRWPAMAEAEECRSGDHSIEWSSATQLPRSFQEVCKSGRCDRPKPAPTPPPLPPFLQGVAAPPEHPPQSAPGSEPQSAQESSESAPPQSAMSEPEAGKSTAPEEPAAPPKPSTASPSASTASPPPTAQPSESTAQQEVCIRVGDESTTLLLDDPASLLLEFPPRGGGVTVHARSRSPSGEMISVSLDLVEAGVSDLPAGGAAAEDGPPSPPPSPGGSSSPLSSCSSCASCDERVREIVASELEQRLAELDPPPHCCHCHHRCHLLVGSSAPLPLESCLLRRINLLLESRMRDQILTICSPHSCVHQHSSECRMRNILRSVLRDLQRCKLRLTYEP